MGLLLLAGLVCGVLGAWFSLQAAYGVPAAMTKDEFHNRGGIDGHHLALASAAARELRHAQLAAVATLVLLAGAVGLTWYGPRSDSALFSVARNGAADLCGRLVSSADGSIDLQPVGAAPVRLRLSALTRLKAVETCP